MTIYDISEKAGVSIATVSRVLNGSPNVKPKTKKKVMDVIEAYDYTPNAFARGLGLNSMNSIGILCADSTDLYLAKAVYFIEQNLRTSGYNCILCCTGYELDSKQKAMNLLMNKRVDSVIMVGSNFIERNDEDNEYIRAAAKNVPVMLLNADYDCTNVYCTLCDDYKSMLIVTEKMIVSGINDILYLYNSRSYSGLKKLSGYQSALLEHELPIQKEYIQFFSGSHEDIEGVCDLVLSLYDSGLRFHGIIASEDFLALGAVKFAKRKSLNIPTDLSIIGYNNSMLTACCDPSLTSVDNHLEKMCNQLTKTLTGVLSGYDMPLKTIFSGELVNRDTTDFT